MIACLAGAAGIALVIFIVIYVYLKSKNNFNYLKKAQSQKKAPFNANRTYIYIKYSPAEYEIERLSNIDIRIYGLFIKRDFEVGLVLFGYC